MNETMRVSRRRLSSFHSPYPYQTYPYFRFSWREDREEGPKTHVNKQKGRPKPERGQRDIFERIVDWINPIEALGMVIGCAPDTFKEISQEKAKDWSKDPCVYDEKTN